MTYKPCTQEAYESILNMYTPLDIKDIITNGASRKAIHHKDKDDILQWYADHNEGLHHNLLDASESVCTQYLFMQKCYNISDKSQEDQYYFIRDVIWLYIDAVAMDLATEYGLLAKSREDIKDEMLAIDLEHRKRQLQIIDGGKA
tara:strand:+ start:424 stop:858 length:435 start_codon:yes stop_codon:yes gene_type:complete